MHTRRDSEFLKEALRYDGANQLVGRVARRRISLDAAGPIEAGARLLLHVAAADHDPAVFDDPERFDPDRPNRDLLAFGAGPGRCIGAAFMMAQATIFLERLACSGLTIRFGPPEFAHALAGRAFRTLPAIVTAGA